MLKKFIYFVSHLYGIKAWLSALTDQISEFDPTMAKENITKTSFWSRKCCPKTFPTAIQHVHGLTTSSKYIYITCIEMSCFPLRWEVNSCSMGNLPVRIER